MKKYILLDDQSIAIGGTNLTTLSILEDRISEVFSIPTANLSLYDIRTNTDKIWIIGNIMNFLNSTNHEIIYELFRTVKFVKLEFDYNFCIYRGEYPHKKFTGESCECPHGKTGSKILSEIYNLINKNAKHIFFMSQKQRDIFYKHLPLLDLDNSSVLSSCFSKDSLKLFKSLKDSPKNDRYAILQGYGGWHSEAKGVNEAVSYCQKNNLKYDLLPNREYEQHLESLAEYRGLVFLPIIEDTCPRCTIEAKLMGLEVVTNLNSQHVSEDWWKIESETDQYLKSRTNYFWSILDKVS